MLVSELKARAERATKGPWFTLGKPWTHDDQTDLAVIAGNRDPHKGTLIAECSLSVDWTDGDDDPRIQEQKDAAYIAAANPSVVLELIGRLEQMEEVAEKVLRETAALVEVHGPAIRSDYGVTNLKCLEIRLEDLKKALSSHGSAAPLGGGG